MSSAIISPYFSAGGMAHVEAVTWDTRVYEFSQDTWQDTRASPPRFSTFRPSMVFTYTLVTHVDSLTVYLGHEPTHLQGRELHRCDDVLRVGRSPLGILTLVRALSLRFS